MRTTSDGHSFSGDPVEDMKAAKQLIAAYPSIDIGSLVATAADQAAPHSARIAAIHVLGFTHHDDRSQATLTRIIEDAGEPNDVRGHAIEAVAFMLSPQADPGVRAASIAGRAATRAGCRSIPATRDTASGGAG